MAHSKNPDLEMRAAENKLLEGAGYDTELSERFLEGPPEVIDYRRVLLSLCYLGCVMCIPVVMYYLHFS